MKPKMAAMLLFTLITICATACGDDITQPTFVPHYTSTPTPVPATSTPEATPTPTNTPTPAYPPVTPVASIKNADGTDFFSILRLLGQGTKVVTDRASEADIEKCFYAETLTSVEVAAFMANGLTEAEANGLYRLRVLYYRPNGSVYIGEMFVKAENAPEVMDLFKNGFAAKTTITDVSDDFVDDFLKAAEYETVGFVSDSREYLYLKK